MATFAISLHLTLDTAAHAEQLAAQINARADASPRLAGQVKAGTSIDGVPIATGDLRWLAENGRDDSLNWLKGQATLRPWVLDARIVSHLETDDEPDPGDPNTAVEMPRLQRESLWIARQAWLARRLSPAVRQITEWRKGAR